jgi:hypothetical protein
MGNKPDIRNDEVEFILSTQGNDGAKVHEDGIPGRTRDTRPLYMLLMTPRRAARSM